MATIRPNDNAPDEAVKYIFPLEAFDLVPGDEFKTDDRNTLSAAEAHPWLDVEYEEFPELSETPARKGVPYEDDVLTSPNSIAFDPEEVLKARAEFQAIDDSRTALDAGLDQGEVVEKGGVAQTLAADEAQDEPANDEKPKAKTSAKNKED